MQEGEGMQKKTPDYDNVFKTMKELLNAVDMGEDALKKVLIGCENPELYFLHGTYQEGGHNRFDGPKWNQFTEKRFCSGEPQFPENHFQVSRSSLKMW